MSPKDSVPFPDFRHDFVVDPPAPSTSYPSAFRARVVPGPPTVSLSHFSFPVVYFSVASRSAFPCFPFSYFPWLSYSSSPSFPPQAPSFPSCQSFARSRYLYCIVHPASHRECFLTGFLCFFFCPLATCLELVPPLLSLQALRPSSFPPPFFFRFPRWVSHAPTRDSNLPLPGLSCLLFFFFPQSPDVG